MVRLTVYRFFVLSTYWKQSISREILAITDVNMYSVIPSKVVTVAVRKYECFIKKNLDSADAFDLICLNTFLVYAKRSPRADCGEIIIMVSTIS